MVISSNMGDFVCSEYDDYIEHLEKNLKRLPGNEIWISARESRDHCNTDFPCSLGILVKDGCQAAVNYFSEGNTEMYASIGDLSRDGSVEFENGQYNVAAYQIISVEQAKEAAMKFWNSLERPDNIEWEEL